MRNSTCAISFIGTFLTWSNVRLESGMRVKPDVTASLWGCPLGEQLSAGRGELHVCPGFVPHHPPFVDRPAELLCRAAGMSEIAI